MSIKVNAAEFMNDNGQWTMDNAASQAQSFTGDKEPIYLPSSISSESALSRKDCVIATLNGPARIQLLA